MNYPEIMALWTQTPPRLRAGTSLWPTTILSAHPNGTRLTVSPGDWKPTLAEQVILELSEPSHNGKMSLRCSITGFSEIENRALELSLVFLKVVETVVPVPSIDDSNWIECPDSFRPVIWADHPWFFNFRLQMSVLSFGPSGIRVMLHSEARGLLPQLEMAFCLALPGVGLFEVRARAKSIDLETCLAHLEWVDAREELRKGIARYLFLAVPGLKPERLESGGYPVADFDFAAVFSYAHTEQEFKDVLDLRLQAYSQRSGSALVGVTDREVMRDEFDAHSLVLAVRVGGRPFGTTRLVFNNGDRDRSEIARLAPLPEWLWENGFVELSRSATLPDARGRDVFASLRRHALRVAYQSGFRYILSDCEGHLLEPYKKRGAQELGVTFIHPLESKTLHVLYYDVAALLKGEVGDPEVWAKFWKPMAEFLGARHGGSFPRI